MEKGTRLGPYEVVSPLGAGGMGEVYLAIDGKLDRRVAIKILPETMTQDKERVARFEREAKVLASLNHPSIAAIYGFDDSDGTRFLVLEYVEGETLGDHLKNGAVAVEDARDIAKQIAEALEAAHENGVIHRDLKPGNVMIRSDGTVKVLDFGLAKAMAEDPSGADNADSQTITADYTRPGDVLGTAAYMSPEQARGRALDKRTDIWSFGVMLYECLTGSRLFGGESANDSIGSVLHKNPDWSQLPAETPEALRRLLQRCLTKDPRHRLHHIADVRIELQATDDDVAYRRVPQLGPAGRRYKIAAASLAVALLVSLLTLLWPVMYPESDRTNLATGNPLAGARFSKITDFQGSEFDAAISPDGSFVTFVSDRDGPFQVFVGQIGTDRFRTLSSGEENFGLQDARAPVRSVGFNHDGSEIWLGGGPWRRVRLAPLLGGPLRNFLGEHAVTVGWSPDGRHVVYHERLEGDPLFVADRDGTNPRRILGSPAGVHQHYPVFSMDGEWIYVSRGRPSTLEMDLWRVRTNGEDLEQMTHGKLDVRYPTPLDGRTVLYSARDSDGAGPWLWTLDVPTRSSRRASVGLERYGSVAASADATRLVATVQDPSSELRSVPILEETATEADVKLFADLSTKRALAPRFGGSSLFYLSSLGSGDGLWRYENGEATEIWRGSETALMEPAAVSPNGEKVLLLLRRNDAWRLHTLESDGTGLAPLTDRVDARGAADWSPDGKWVVTGGFEGGVEGLFKIPVDGGAPQRLVEGEALNPVWSNEGLIVYTGAQINVVSPLLGVRPDGTRVDLPKLDVFRFGQRARFLPDGSGLVTMRGFGPAQDFWLLDLKTMKDRRLTQLDSPKTMRSFDITPDGTQIVFDRLSEDSDIVLIELGPH